MTPGSSPGPRDIAHLKSFCAEYKAEVRGGLILHGGEEIYWLDEKIAAIPWWRIL